MSNKTSTKKKNTPTGKSTPKATATLIETVATPQVDIVNESTTIVGGETKKPKKEKDINQRSLTSKVLSQLVGEGKELSRYNKTVAKILSLEDKYKAMSDSELKAETERFRAKFVGVNDVKTKEKILNDILPEAFATVREGAYRAIGLKHFPVQLIGGMVLHEGRIAEMRTGEGKTLVSTLSGYLNALPPQNQVHLVTVNDYLARRDASWMGQIYNFLGLSIGVIQNQASFYFKFGAQASELDDKKRAAGLLETYEDGEKEDSRTVLDVEHLVHCDRKRAYWDDELDRPVDIVYGVNSEFGFDYLRDNMASTPQEVSQRAGHKVAIVDEVDSILIDEARTPLIISSQDADSSARYKQFSGIVKRLRKDIDYEVDEKRKIVTLTELGIEKVERELGISNLYGNPENVVLIHHLDQALRAAALFTRDKEYVVRDGEIVIVDENTGRMMVGRRYNQGLHQAIEAKEDVQVQSESKTTASITFQNYFRLYEKLSGMTGTAATESEEFFKIYKLLVVTIPTNKAIARIDKPDNIYKSEKGKFEAIAMDVQALHAKGQPVLIGTTSIEKNLLLSEFLKKYNVPHQILNAKNHEQEAKIISEAGRRGAVTLATNIAGRGIDIKLGGEPPKDKSKYAAWKKDHEEILQLGGLHVIGTERHESRRIDNQLRGRAGRQGDTGSSQFYVSLEDYLIRVFGGDRLKFYQFLPIADHEAIQHNSISWVIEQAQKKIEGQNFDIRKHVTDYDDVINRQRSVIYSRRHKVLVNDGFEWKKELEKTIYREVFRIIKDLKKPKKVDSPEYQSYLQTVSSDLKGILKLTDFDVEVLKVLFKDEKYKSRRIALFLTEKILYQLNKSWDEYSDSEQAAITRFSFLRAIDILWTEHLVTIEHLQDAVRLRGYSQKDPLTEFKEEGLKIFINLLEEVDKEIARTILKITPDFVPAGIMKTS